MGIVKAEYSATDMLVFLLRNIAYSNAVLTAAKLTTQDRRDFWPIVSSGRISFQRLCDAAIFATSTPKHGRPRLQSQIPSGATSRATSVSLEGVDGLSIQATAEDATVAATKKKRQYMQYKTVPNVHIGHHYVDVLNRYGLPSLLMVFAGEQKHK